MFAFFGILSLLGIIIFLISSIIFAIKRNPLWKKLIFASIGCFILLIVIAIADPNKGKDSTANITTPPSQQTETTKEKTNEQPPTPAKPEATPQEKIDKIVRDTTKDNYIKTETVVRADGSLVPEIHIKGHENLTSSFTRKSIYKEGADIFEKIYASGLPIKEIRECIYLPLTDKYGNTKDDIVVRMTLNSETAAKINWKGVDKLAFDKVADNVWIHPALLRE